MNYEISQPPMMGQLFFYEGSSAMMPTVEALPLIKKAKK